MNNQSSNGTNTASPVSLLGMWFTILGTWESIQIKNIMKFLVDPTGSDPIHPIRSDSTRSDPIRSDSIHPIRSDPIHPIRSDPMGTSPVGCTRKMLFAVNPVSCTAGSSRRPKRTCFQQHLPKAASALVAVDAFLTFTRSLPSQLSLAQAFTGILGFFATTSMRQSQQLQTCQFSSP